MVIARRCLLIPLVMGLMVSLTGCMQALKTDSASTIASPSPFLSSTATASVPVNSDSPLAFEPSPDPEVVASDVNESISADSIPESGDPQGPYVTPADMSASLSADSPLPEANSEIAPGVPVDSSPTETATDVPSPEPTATATALPQAVPTTSPTEPVVIVAPTLPVLSHEERWRGQQLNRTPFSALRQYTTSGSELWWFDPVNQQHVILGSFAGDFQAQASFIVRGQGLPALEVPYQVNQSYGLTSVSSVLVERIHQAGHDEWIETYMFVTPNVQQR